MVVLYVQWVLLMGQPRTEVVVVVVSRGLLSLGRWVTRVTSAENWAARVAAEGLQSIADFAKCPPTGIRRPPDLMRVEILEYLDCIDKFNGIFSIGQSHVYGVFPILRSR